MYGLQTEVSPSSGRLQPVIRANGAVVARFPHPNDGPVELAGVTSRTGINFHVKTDGNDDLDGLSWDTAVASFTKAIERATAGRGDQVHARPGDYDEAEIDVNKADLAIIGHGANGAVGITPSSGINGMKITANDVVLQNIRIEGVNDSDYGLSIGNPTTEVLGVRVYGCLLRNGTHASNPAVLVVGAGDLYIVGCDIAWAAQGIVFKAGVGFPTQIFIKSNHFHNLTATHISKGELGVGFDLVFNVNIIGNTFDNLEDGTVPSVGYIQLDRANSTGLITGNAFATATNASANVIIASNIMYVANYTEAGITAARPG